MSTLSQRNRPQDLQVDPGARQRGFTLLELVTIIATAAVLIAVLLPAVQKVRKAVLSGKAAAHLTAMVGPIRTWRIASPLSPVDLTGLDDFCKDHPCDPAVVRIAQGRELDGYWFDLAGGPDTWQAVAEPLFPGLTGDETLTISGNTISGNTNTSSSPTPLADHNRRRAIHHILARGAEIVGGLLTLNPDAAASLHDTLTSPGTVPQVFSSLDLNGDGILTLAELNGSQPGPSQPNPGPLQINRGPVQDFLAFVAEELKWNSSGEDLGATGVDFAALQLPALQDASLEPLFTYDGLCRVGSAMSHHPSFVRPFCRGLDAAQAAAERGDLDSRNRILDTLSRRVAAQAGTGILLKDANALIGLLRVLRAGGPS